MLVMLQNLCSIQNRWHPFPLVKIIICTSHYNDKGVSAGDEQAQDLKFFSFILSQAFSVVDIVTIKEVLLC